MHYLISTREVSGRPGDGLAGLQVVVIGVAGTMLLNLMRVAAVAALEVTLGHLPALLFHDYGGTILVIAWLFVLWIAVQRWILVLPPSNDAEKVNA